MWGNTCPSWRTSSQSITGSIHIPKTAVSLDLAPRVHLFSMEASTESPSSTGAHLSIQAPYPAPCPWAQGLCLIPSRSSVYIARRPPLPAGLMQAPRHSLSMQRAGRMPHTVCGLRRSDHAPGAWPALCRAVTLRCGAPCPRPAHARSGRAAALHTVADASRRSAGGGGSGATMEARAAAPRS